MVKQPARDSHHLIQVNPDTGCIVQYACVFNWQHLFKAGIFKWIDTGNALILLGCFHRYRRVVVLVKDLIEHLHPALPQDLTVLLSAIHMQTYTHTPVWTHSDTYTHTPVRTHSDTYTHTPVRTHTFISIYQQQTTK